MQSVRVPLNGDQQIGDGGLANRELLLQRKRVAIVTDRLGHAHCARHGSLLYRLDSVLGQPGAHGLANNRVLPGEFRVR